MQVHLFHQAFRRGGGTERFALDTASALVEAGHRVTFHCREADPRLAEAKAIEVQRLKVARWPRKLRDYRFFRRVSEWAPGLEGPQVAFARVPVRDVVICGGTHRGYLAKARKWKGPFDHLQIHLEAEAYRSCRRVFVVSALCASELTHRYGVADGKVRIVPPPVDPRNFKPAAAAERLKTRERLGFPPDKVVFLFPSTGHRRKGLGPIVSAFASVEDRAILAVAGKPPGGSGRSWLKYVGYREDMPAIYAAADFTILGSYYEPFGLVGVESILAGTKPVLEERMGCLEVIQPGSAITFSVWREESIRDALCAAVAEAGCGRHRVDDPGDALRYDPSPQAFARRLLEEIGERRGSAARD